MLTMSKRFRALRAGKSEIGTYGPGTPAYIMAHRVRALLLRMRQAVTFPVPMGEFLALMLPMDLSGNLSKCISWGGIAHFKVEGRTAQETFWVKHPEGLLVPVPADASELFLFSTENKHFAEINKWLTAALELQVDLQAMYEITARFIRQARHPDVVRDMWPDLFKFVEASLPKRYAADSKGGRVELPHPRARGEITDMLAKASLMPDRQALAWVQYPGGEDDG